MSIEEIRVPYNYFNPRPYQSELFQALEKGYKRIIACWSRQMGKDTTAFCAMVMRAIQTPGNYFYIFPTRESAKKAVWEKIDHDGKMLLSVIPDQLILRKSDQEMMVRVKAIGGESTIRFVGLDHNPDSIRGITPAGVVFSEFAYQDPRAYKIIMPAIRQNKNCWTIYETTPNGRNHFWKMYKANLNNPEWFISTKQVLYPDKDTYVKGVISLDEISKIKAEEGLTEEEIAQEFGCDFSIGAQGAIFADCIQQAEADGRIGEFPPQQDKWVDTFWDLGYNDPTAIWFRQIEGKWENLVDYWQGVEKDVFKIVEVLVAKGYKFRNHYLPFDADSNFPGMPFTFHELLRSALYQSPLKFHGNITVCDKLPKQDSINGVRANFLNFRFDDFRTKEGREFLELYHRRYDPKRGTYIKEPVHDASSHAADALQTHTAAGEFIPFNDGRDKIIKIHYDSDILE